MTTSNGRPPDRAMQSWVRATGRRIEFAEYPWLDGPTGDPNGIGDEWIDREAARLGGQVAASGPDDGLLASMGALAGRRFDPTRLRSGLSPLRAAVPETPLQ
jgi:hypothetical protein